MRSLSFKQRYVEPIVNGDKRTTLRKQIGKAEVGDVIAATCQWGKPPFAWLEITGVQRVDLDELTEGMARDDGFESAVELRKELATIYPDLNQLVRVTFRPVPRPAGIGTTE